MKKILFVCTGNSCRSVMAEGLFKKMTEGRKEQFEISSAGISAIDGYPPTAETIRVMETEGADVSEHRSRRLTMDMIRQSDHIYVMERFHRDFILRLAPEAAAKVSLLTEYTTRSDGRNVDIDIPDPINMSGQFYKNILSVIRDCLENILQEG